MPPSVGSCLSSRGAGRSLLRDNCSCPGTSQAFPVVGLGAAGVGGGLCKGSREWCGARCPGSLTPEWARTLKPPGPLASSWQPFCGLPAQSPGWPPQPACWPFCSPVLPQHPARWSQVAPKAQVHTHGLTHPRAPARPCVPSSAGATAILTPETPRDVHSRSWTPQAPAPS